MDLFLEGACAAKREQQRVLHSLSSPSAKSTHPLAHRFARPHIQKAKTKRCLRVNKKKRRKNSGGWKGGLKECLAKLMKVKTSTTLGPAAFTHSVGCESLRRSNRRRISTTHRPFNNRPTERPPTTQPPTTHRPLAKRGRKVGKIQLFERESAVADFLN